MVERGAVILPFLQKKRPGNATEVSISGPGGGGMAGVQCVALPKIISSSDSGRVAGGGFGMPAHARNSLSGMRQRPRCLAAPGIVPRWQALRKLLPGMLRPALTAICCASS